MSWSSLKLKWKASGPTTSVIQDLLHIYVLSERKIRYALAHVPNSVQVRAPKQTICHGRKGKSVENSQEDTRKEIAPQTVDWSLQSDDDTDAKTVTPKLTHEVAGKAKASNRSTDGQSKGSKTSSSTHMLPSPWSLNIELQLLLDLIWSEARCTYQVEARTFHIFPDNRTSLQKLKRRSKGISGSNAGSPWKSALFIEEKEVQRQPFRISIPKKTKSHPVRSIHVSQWFRSELSYWIRYTLLEYHDFSKSYG